jgi:anthranilate synthase component 1
VSSATGNPTRSGNSIIKAIKPGFDLLSLMQAKPERYPFLLQSNASGPDLARYDILFACPGETLSLDANGGLHGPYAESANGFLAALDNWWTNDYPDAAEQPLVPFTGGWFLYLGYELAGEVEPGLQLQHKPGMPVAFATRVPAAIVVDHDDGTAWLVAEADQPELLLTIESDLKQKRDASGNRAGVMSVKEDPPDIFIAAVARAKQYISDGDIFQANLSRSWHAVLAPEFDPIELYQRLCKTNPAPFAGLLRHPDFTLLSSSPERLVKRKGQRIDTRPIAGTRPRTEGPNGTEDRKQELLQHPKERAEHIMLIDLERNDLGRICVGGSVTVDECMVVESYSHVHHIVSNISGIARDNVTPGELIRAVFPGGTITGCPKVRCMEIIAELEQRPRGAYTGSMGYLNRNGDCDLNILIRSMTIIGNEIELSAGSGIVADSDPQAELEETRAKAKGLLLALRGDLAGSGGA